MSLRRLDGRSEVSSRDPALRLREFLEVGEGDSEGSEGGHVTFSSPSESGCEGRAVSQLLMLFWLLLPVDMNEWLHCHSRPRDNIITLKKASSE